MISPEIEQVSPSANQQQAMLHLLCGRIAAGKSTLAKSLARRYDAVLIGEDHCLSTLYANTIHTFDDYRVYAKRLRELLTPHCVQLLKRGINVVLDFPANTPNCRQWLKNIIQEGDARHVLHYLTTSKQDCWQRLLERNETQNTNASPIAVNEFDVINGYFIPPDVSEGFNVEIVR